MTFTATNSNGHQVLIKLVDELELEITMHVSKLLSSTNPSFLPVLDVLKTPLGSAVVLPFVSSKPPVPHTSVYDFTVLVLKVLELPAHMCTSLGFSVSYLIFILFCVQALAALEQINIAHGDIKQGIVLFSDGVVILLDFGLSELDATDDDFSKDMKDLTKFIRKLTVSKTAMVALPCLQQTNTVLFLL